MSRSLHPAAPPPPTRPAVVVGANDPGPAERVLEEITHELTRLLGDGITADAIRTDVDVFEGREPLVAGRWLDSMDLVQVMAALEARFGVQLAALLTGDEPMTLINVAHHIAAATSRFRP